MPKILLIILAILLPPVAAFLQVQLTLHFWLVARGGGASVA